MVSFKQLRFDTARSDYQMVSRARQQTVQGTVAGATACHKKTRAAKDRPMTGETRPKRSGFTYIDPSIHPSIHCIYLAMYYMALLCMYLSTHLYINLSSDVSIYRSIHYIDLSISISIFYRTFNYLITISIYLYLSNLHAFVYI